MKLGNGYEARRTRHYFMFFVSVFGLTVRNPQQELNCVEAAELCKLFSIVWGRKTKIVHDCGASNKLIAVSFMDFEVCINVSYPVILNYATV